MIIMVTVKATVMLNSQRTQWGRGGWGGEILETLKQWVVMHWSPGGAGSGALPRCALSSQLCRSHTASSGLHRGTMPFLRVSALSPPHCHWLQILFVARAAPVAQVNPQCASAGSVLRVHQPRSRALQPSAPSHLGSGQCFVLTLSHASSPITGGWAARS